MVKKCNFLKLYLAASLHHRKGNKLVKRDWQSFLRMFMGLLSGEKIKIFSPLGKKKGQSKKDQPKFSASEMCMGL